MLTTIFRLGPLVLLELGFITAAVIIGLFEELSSCSCYTLGYMALITFLIEMIASIRMTKQQSSVRREYLCARVAETNCRYYCRLVWDNLNFLLVIMLLYYSLVIDGITLSTLTNNSIASNGSQDSQECQYTLFSLCLFNELEKSLKSDVKEHLMVMWLLYTAGAFMTSIVCVIFSREYYQYCASINSNRKMAGQFGTINETLLDCHVYSIRSETVIEDRIRDQVGICPICIHEILDSKQSKSQQLIVRLRCGHMFHKECINSWLMVKDHCPFRCSGSPERQ